MAEADLPASRRTAQLMLSDLPIFSPGDDAISSHRIVGFDSRDARARPFSLMRTSFAKRAKEVGHRLIGLTSATPAAGKSFLSLNLAASLARVSDHSVYLVDLDLRRASLAEELGISVETGIEAFLDGSASDLGKIGFKIEGTELGVFPANKVRRNTAELLSCNNFTTLVRTFRECVGESIVLFDLPPVFANDDAMIIMEQLDSYIMVVDTGKTTRRHVKDVLSMLNPTPCLGSILNRYSGGFADDYGYGYGYGRSAYARYYEES